MPLHGHPITVRSKEQNYKRVFFLSKLLNGFVCLKKCICVTDSVSVSPPPGVVSAEVHCCLMSDFITRKNRFNLS